MKSRFALIALLTLAAAPTLAHSPRSPSPMARLDALAMPGLAPARALMAEMLHDMDRPAPRPVLPEVTTRRATPFFWGWFRAPVTVIRHESPRCEVIYTPYAGRIETCTPAPRARHGAVGEVWIEGR
jgi:hypothetical protein